MRFGFATCVQLGLSCMEEIYRIGGKLDLALTLRDEQARQKSGRVYLDRFCAAHDLNLLKIGHINDGESVAAIRAAGIDWLFIIGWSQIASQCVLDAPRRGTIGMHPTLLPTGRGRAAIPWAILKRLPETGVTLFQLAAGVDCGPILAQHVLPLSPDETATSLYRRVEEAHRLLLARAWPDLAAGLLIARPQDESKATLWPGRTPADGEITPAMTVSDAECLVRATTRPYPGAFYRLPEGTLRVWAGRPSAHTAEAVCVYRLRLADGCYDVTEGAMEPANEPAAVARRLTA